MENVKWDCEKCGGHFDLDSASGRCSAHYGLCRKCGIEFVIRTYKKSNFLAKVFFFIPYFLIKIGYNKVYKTEHQVEKLIEELSSEPIESSVPKLNSNFSEFEWNGIVYMIPPKYYGMPVDAETMKKIAIEISEEEEILARITQAEIDIYERFEQNDDDFFE